MHIEIILLALLVDRDALEDQIVLVVRRDRRRPFDRVQELLKSNSQGRKVKRSESGALLQCKLFDDKGNRMSPSFSSKNGVRYRFYVSSALLRGRKAASGSVARVGAEAIEQTILKALCTQDVDRALDDSELLNRHVLRAQIGKSKIELSLRLDEAPEAAQSRPVRRRSPPILYVA
jgi:hypothetical protein